MSNLITDALPRVLVVEDDDDTREMLRDLLVSSGYLPETVTSGEEALDFLAHDTADTILLDLRLPGMSGYDICERIRASDNGHLPILMLTANQEPGGASRGLRLGADDYLRKPFAPDELLSRIEAIRQRHQASLALVTEQEALRRMLEGVQAEFETARITSSTEGTLRREFLHNVTTHLRALCNVIESEYRRAPLGPSREIVQRILGRVRGATLVYETSELLQEDPARVDTLIHIIGSALKHIYAPRTRLPLTVQGGPVELPLMYAAPVAMIVNELITNSFKHAFPEQRFGAIKIAYEYTPQEFRLQVIDDGVGFSPEKAHAGRGIATVRQLMQHMKGNATWDSGSSGTTVTIMFPSMLQA